MKWKKVTGTPVSVRSVQAHQMREGSILVSLDIVTADGNSSKIVLSIPAVEFLAESFTQILDKIKERTESN
jgi:hypothetical protein